MSPAFQTLIEAARWAPSGDNTQPWRFIIDEQQRTIEVCVDSTRDTSPMNAGQRMARIAVGAAVENIVQTAEANGWWNKISFRDGSPGSVQIQLDNLVSQTGVIPERILQRVTNRTCYDGRPITVEALAHVQRSLGVIEHVSVVWISERSQIRELARLIGAADALMFGTPHVRAAFLQNIRFDRPIKEAVTEGLSLGSLEPSCGDIVGLRLLRRLPDSIFRALRMRRAFQKKAAQLVTSASGLCIVLANDSTRACDVHVGILMQRTWTHLTEAGLAVQPMMSVPVLDNMRSAGASINGGGKFIATLDAVKKKVGGDFGQRIGAILRFGNSAAPSSRTGRRAVSSLTAILQAPAIPFLESSP